MQKVVISIGIVVAIALVVCLAPLKEVAYAITVDYEDTETYYENEPYEVTENYTEDVQVELQILEHHLEEGFLWQVLGKVKNTSNQTLHWMDVIIGVEYEIEDFPGRTFGMSGTLDPTPTTFKPGEIRDFSVLVQEGTISYEITPPTVTQTVERERTVTKYREVQKQRTVTRQRQGTRYKKVTLLDYLLHYR